MAARTFTYTWTHTRLETIQDQFRYFMTYGNVDDGYVEKVVYGIGEKAIQAVGLFACDSSGLRVIEAELRVDWELSAKLSLSIPNISSSGLTGWDGTQAPEIKVAGRRFAQTAERLQLAINFWVLFTPAVRASSSNHEAWCKRVGVAINNPPPNWKEQPEDRTDTLLDLREAQVTLRRATGL